MKQERGGLSATFTSWRWPWSQMFYRPLVHLVWDPPHPHSLTFTQALQDHVARSKGVYRAERTAWAVHVVPSTAGAVCLYKFTHTVP